jgi:hypothetical protein
MTRAKTTTAELRWFFDGELPAEVGRWFASDALGPFEAEWQSLDDHYLWTGHADENLKLRGDELQYKRRLGVAPVSYAGVHGLLEHWESSVRPRRQGDDVRSLETIVEKKRRLAHFERVGGMVAAAKALSMEEPTCTVEIASVQVLAHRGWTLCLEATRDDAELVQQVLVLMMKTFPEKELGQLTADRSQGYAAWLLVHGKPPRMSDDEARAALPSVSVS